MLFHTENLTIFFRNSLWNSFARQPILDIYFCVNKLVKTKIKIKPSYFIYFLNSRISSRISGRFQVIFDHSILYFIFWFWSWRSKILNEVKSFGFRVSWGHLGSNTRQFVMIWLLMSGNDRPLNNWKIKNSEVGCACVFKKMIIIYYRKIILKFKRDFMVFDFLCNLPKILMKKILETLFKKFLRSHFNIGRPFQNYSRTV